MGTEIPRRVEPIARARMGEAPVLLLEGQRSVGKSTLLRSLGQPDNAPIYDLDQTAFLALAENSPSLIADARAPVLIDEYQKAASILDAIKARLNAGTEPGMFVLAGSSSFDALPRSAQALTGRIQRLAIHPLTQTEIDATDNELLQQAFDGQVEHVSAPSRTRRPAYIDRVTRGGMPLALAAPSETARTRWFEGHTRQSLERDAGELRQLGRKGDLPKLLTYAAAQTAQLLNISKASRVMEIPRDTVSSYLTLLESLFLIAPLPAWGATVASRSVSTPKLHVVDSGAGAFLMRLSASKLARLDPAALTEFGHLLESFVVQEVIRHASWLDAPVSAGHWRTRDGDEVDLVLERHDGAVVAIEVKAGEKVDGKQLAPLAKLRERLGSSFLAGITFYLGSTGYVADDRLHVLPVDRLWVT